MDPVEDIMKEVVGRTKRVAGDEFPDLGEIQDSTPEELIEDNLMDMNDSVLGPYNEEEAEEAVPGVLPWWPSG